MRNMGVLVGGTMLATAAVIFTYGAASMATVTGNFAWVVFKNYV